MLLTQPAHAHVRSSAPGILLAPLLLEKGTERWLGSTVLGYEKRCSWDEMRAWFSTVCGGPTGQFVSVPSQAAVGKAGKA